MRISFLLVRKKIRTSSQLSQLRGLRPLRVKLLLYLENNEIHPALQRIA